MRCGSKYRNNVEDCNSKMTTVGFGEESRYALRVGGGEKGGGRSSNHRF